MFMFKFNDFFFCGKNILLISPSYVYLHEAGKCISMHNTMCEVMHQELSTCDQITQDASESFMPIKTLTVNK